MARTPVNLPEMSNVECVECGDLIPLKRVLILANCQTCVDCAEELEADGRGTTKHRMNYLVQTKGDDIESIDMEIVRTPDKRLKR